MSEKIKPQHVARKAILYVRQSSAYQVNHNLESQRLQYAMQDRLHYLGWREIDVVDDDLGRSAAGTVARVGFERMVAEVCLGNVGGVAAREVSRFARNSREWQHLVEVCRVVDTVLIDLEAVYSPRLSNDRLLLGLKGSLNEYELDLLRQRSVEARRAKAQRGELLVAAPVGFLKTEAPHFEKDPDRRIQDAVALVFQTLSELGTVRQTLSWFLEHDLQLPARSVSGEITWRRPSFGVLYRMLSNPIYGAGPAECGTAQTAGTARHNQRCTEGAAAGGAVMNVHPDGQHSIDLADLIKDPSRLASVDRSHIPALLTQLSAVQASMAARFVATAQDATSDARDALLNVEKAAERLGVSEDWLYRRTKTLSFVVRVGRHVRFSAKGIDRYIRNRMGR